MLLGYYRGLVKSILSVAQYFVVIILSLFLAPVVSEILIDNFNLDLIIIEWIENNENLFLDTLSIINEEICCTAARPGYGIFLCSLRRRKGHSGGCRTGSAPCSHAL